MKAQTRPHIGITPTKTPSPPPNYSTYPALERASKSRHSITRGSNKTRKSFDRERAYNNSKKKYDIDLW
jgi:hypothetical protein